MLPASAPDPRPKRRIGRYTVTGRVGRGGMGMVYRGHDEVLDREVAIKTLTVEGTLDFESRRRFEVEARAAARLQHPNILTVYELGEDRGIPFIAMELLHGADLDGVVRSGEALSLHEILEVMIQVCRGLAFAHEHGIVHRDIKPTNIRLLDDGGVKIMDFGIAKLGGTNLTRSGMLVGTVYYMSPEQIQARPLDGRSDVFSAGVILHELLAGARPFAGETPTQVLYKIVHEDAPVLRVELGAAGAKLQQILARALARAPEARFESASRMADALTEALGVHLQANPSGATPEDLESASTARRLIRDGRLSEARRLLDATLERRPGCLEARRALRLIERAAARPGAPTQDEAFPELDATFQSPATQQQPSTQVEAAPPTVQHERPVASSAAPTPARTSTGRGALIGAGAALLVAAVAGMLLLRGESPESMALPASLAALPEQPAALVPTPPPPSMRAEKPAAPIPGPARPETLAEPEPVAAPGTVNVRSSYPVDVVWKGRTLAKAELTPSVALPSGRQTLSLVSDEYFLRRSVSVDVTAGGSAAIDVAPPGRISIRATPDNCEVSLDGTFVDYPPILDKSVASGSRTVGFKWPDGTRREESVEVEPGRLAYVSGRKEQP